MTARAQATPLRRGVCPGLSAPMPTGDGLLVRLQPTGTIALAAFAALCAAARQHGNGVIEVTSRGNIQVRGLGTLSAPRFAAAIAALAIAADNGVPVLCSPLAGLDPDEPIDALAFAGDLRHGLARAPHTERLSAKTSIVIESGAALDPAHVPADVRLSARPMGRQIVFDIAVGGDRGGATPLGCLAREDANEAVTRLLDVLIGRGGERRARDILATEGRATFRAALADILFAADPEELDSRWSACSGQPKARPGNGNERDVIGVHLLRDGSLARGIGLAFGHSDAASLDRLVAAAAEAGASGFRAAPGRALLVIGVPPASATALAAVADDLGFITRAGDPRRRIIACAGAPICASAHIAARVLAPGIAGRTEFSVHVSGCAKGCAHPAPASLTVVGTADGCALVADGSARDAPFAVVSEHDLAAAVERFAHERSHENSHV